MDNPTAQKCPRCGGTGEVFATVNGKREVVRCSLCSGTGRVIGVPEGMIVVADSKGRVAVFPENKPFRVLTRIPEKDECLKHETYEKFQARLYYCGGSPDTDKWYYEETHDKEGYCLYDAWPPQSTS